MYSIFAMIMSSEDAYHGLAPQNQYSHPPDLSFFFFDMRERL